MNADRLLAWSLLAGCAISLAADVSVSLAQPTAAPPPAQPAAPHSPQYVDVTGQSGAQALAFVQGSWPQFKPGSRVVLIQPGSPLYLAVRGEGGARIVGIDATVETWQTQQGPIVVVEFTPDDSLLAGFIATHYKDAAKWNWVGPWNPTPGLGAERWPDRLGQDLQPEGTP